MNAHNIVSNKSKTARTRGDLVEALEQRQLLNADLSGTFLVTPAAAVNGSVLLAALQVSNTGDTRARAPFTADIYLLPSGSTFSTATANRVLRLNRPFSLAAGATHQVNFRVPIARSIVAGDYQVVAVIDPRNRVAESDESNNIVTSGAFAVQQRPASVSTARTLGGRIGKNVSSSLLLTTQGGANGSTGVGASTGVAAGSTSTARTGTVGIGNTATGTGMKAGGTVATGTNSGAAAGTAPTNAIGTTPTNSIGTTPTNATGTTPTGIGTTATGTMIGTTGNAIGTTGANVTGATLNTGTLSGTTLFGGNITSATLTNPVTLTPSIGTGNALIDSTSTSASSFGTLPTNTETFTPTTSISGIPIDSTTNTALNSMAGLSLTPINTTSGLGLTTTDLGTTGMALI